MPGGNWYSEELLAQFKARAVAGITDGIALVEAEAVRLITDGPKTGTVYTTMFFTVGTGPTRVVHPYGSRVPHQASAPGEAPANDTGFLVQNRTVAVDASQIRATLTFHAAYAGYLEFGTDRIEPRPFARPALMNTWESVVAAMKQAIQRPLQ